MANICARSSGVSPSRFGSFFAYTGEPPRSSSQFGPASMCIGLPVTFEMGRAVGWSSPSGALNRSSNLYVQGS